MSNNLGFEYVLNVNEQATKQNLNTFIKKTFGEGKNAKLSVPIKIDVANSLSDINFDQLQKDIDRNIKNKLKVKATVVLDTNSIKTQLTSKIGEIEKDLKFKVGLEIDPSAINLIAGTVDVMKTLNAEIDKVKGNMKELGKNLTINIGDVHLGKQYDEILETSKEIKEENKETEASLEEQLNIQKRILEEKRNQMKQTEKDIKAEEKRLNLAKERKDNNDKLIEQEKQLRKEASNLDEQIKAEQDKQKTYEKQNDALKKQSKEQKKLADDLKKTNEEIKKLENDKTSAQQRVNLAKEEEQRRANNLEMMKKENEALKEKLANLQKIANVTNEATTVDKTNKTSKGSSIKQQANDAIKQVTNVSEKRIEQEKQVTNEIEKQSEAQIKAINKVTEAENKAEKAKAKSSSSTTKKSSTGKKSGGSKRRNLYEDVQSAEIAKAIHDETVQGVRSYEEERAEMRRLGDMIANERGLLQQVTECLERNKELTKENADEVQNLLTKLADEKTLIQEAAGNRDYVNYADFKNALKKYQADPSDKNLEKLEWQMEKWGKIGAMYEYRKDVQEAINTLQKQYNIEAQRSLEIEEKQNKINEQRTSQNTQKNEAKANNWLKGKFGKYKDAGSYMEEMVGFTKDELYDALLEYEEVIDKFRLQDDDAIDYEKTERFFGRITKQINEYKEAAAKATDERVINKYTEAIENLNNMITNTKKNINTWEELNRIYLADSDFDVTEDAKQKDVDLDKVISLKKTVSEFTQYSQAMNLAKEQTSEMRQDLSWLAKDFDKLVAEKSMDEEKWQSLTDKVQQYKKELGVTEDQIRQFINTKNAEIEQGNEHLAKLKELQKTFKRGTNEYRECSKVIKDYNNVLDNDLPLTDTIKDMKELINILDRGKDSFDSFSDTNTGEKTVKVVKKQKASIEELAKQMENQDIMAEKIYLANKKNEQAMIDINQVIDRQRKTWKDLTGEVEKYYSKLSSEEVDKGLSIIRAEDKAEKNPNYRISNYMTKSLNEENLSLKEKISLLAEYEAKSKVIEVLKRKVNQVEKYGLSYLKDEEDEIQRLNQKKQEQINKTINHTKATQNNNKALKEQAKVSKNIAKIDVTQQNKNMQELFRSVALGDNNLENLSELLKLVKNEVEKFSLALSSGTGLTDEARKSMYALKESFTKAEQALTTMEQKTGNANFTIEKGSKGFNAQKDVLAKLYKEIYNVSESTQESNQVEERANKIAEDKAKNTNKVVETIKQETNAIDEKTMALKSMALQAGIAEEKLEDLLMRIGNVIGSGKKLSKTEMTKLAKDFPTEDLASASERRSNLISEGRKGKYNQTDEYKQRKGQLDALVANYTDNAFDLFQKIYNEAKNLDKVVEQTNKKVELTSKPKKQETTQQNEVAKAIENVTEAKQEQNKISENIEAEQQARIREQVQLIENMSDAQQRFNAILELTGLNYDNIYKKHEKEIKTLDKAMIWKATGNAAMDMGYESNIGGGDKTTYVGQYMKNKNTDMNNKKVNTDMLSEYYAKKDILGEYEKILGQYDYANKTAEELLYDISEKGLRDSLAIETALQKTTKNEKAVLEDIARIKQEIAKEGKVDLETNNKQLNQLKEQLKAYEQGSGVYSKYIEDAQKQALQMVRDGKQEVTDKAVKQAMFKILGNNDTNIAYDKQIGKTDEFDKISKRLGFNKQEAQEFYDIYFKVNQLKKEISDLESKSGDSYYSRVLENLEKEKAVLEENKNYLTSLLPKQQEQAQIQQQQAEAVLETAQATEKLVKAQEKIKTNILDSDSLNGGNAVNKEHYLPDAAIALMEAQMGTYLKNGKVTASFKDYDYEGYDNPRDKMAKEYIVYHERFEELNNVLKRMVEMAISEDDVLNKNDFQALRKQYDRLVNIMENDIRNIINGLESQGAEPFLKGDFANVEDMLKANPKQAWALSPDDLAQDVANGNKGLFDENIKQLEELIQAQKERAEHERTIRQETKQAEAEVRKELESTKVNLSDIDSVYTRIYENVINVIKASEKFKKLSPSSEDFNAIKLLEEDANYAAEAGLNEGYWQTLVGAALDSAKILGVAVDEQQALFNKEIEIYNKQIDIMAQEATLSAKVSEDKAEQIQQEEKITNNKVEQIQQEEKVAKVVEESTENYKQAYEEVMRLIEASKEYSKLSEKSSEKIDFQDLRDRAETIADDDVAQWKEMHQLSLSLGDEMELNIERERLLNKIKQQTLEKTKALLSDGRTTEQYWKDEKEAIEKESSAIEENINAKKQETSVTEQVAQAEAKSSEQADKTATSKNKVAKASKNVTNALKEEQQALVASTNVKDHIEATLAVLDKVNKSATFKKKAKENSGLQDMFNELKREANINKSSGVLGIDYWDGLIDRIKIFATEIVKVKAKTIDDTVKPLIYKDGGTTSTTKTTSTSKPLSREDFKAQQEEKAKQRQIRQQEKEAQKLKEQREEAEALEIVLKQLEDTITNNPHTQLLKVYEDITKITDAQERFNKILEVTGLSYDEVYQKALKSERTHAQKNGGIDIDEIFTKQLASFNRDDNPYNTLNYMSVANIKGFNDRVDYVAEYRAREKVLQNFINAIKTTMSQEKEFIAQQELEIKTLKAYPSEAKKMLDTQRQMAEGNQEISTKSKELVDNLETSTSQITNTKKAVEELASTIKEVNIDELKDKFGRTWKQIANDEAKAMKKVKEDIIMFELYNMEMDENYTNRDDEQKKRYNPLNYMKDINIDSIKTSKDAIPLLSEYYAKIQVLTELKKQEEQATAQITQDLKESNKELDKAIDKTENLAIPLENKKQRNKKENASKSTDSNNVKPIIVDSNITTDETNKAKDLQDATNNIKNINKEIVDAKQEDKQVTQEVTNEVEKQTNLIEKQKQAEETKLVVDEKSKQIKQETTQEIKQQTEVVAETAKLVEQETNNIVKQTNAIQEQTKAEEQKQVIDKKSKEIKQNKVEVENEEVKALQEQIAKNEELIKQEEEAMQDAKETATMHEMEVATINYKIKQAKELRDEQEKQLANANENNEKMKEEYILQDEGIKRITEKIKALEEEKRLKEQMADDLKQQLIQEEALGDVSNDVLNSMIDDYNRLRKEAEDTKKSIDLITTAIKNQKDYEEMSRTGVNPLQPINNSPQSAPNWTTGGSGGSNGGGNNNDGSIREGNAYNEILSERIKLKQRALMLDIENLVYGKDLTDSQKLMVNELVEQVVQLGRSVTSMKELSFEAQKIKQNINETKFDVKVSTTEDKNAKKLLEQKRKETTEMYKGLFDQAIAQEEAKLNAEREKRNELTRMYTRLMDEAIAKEDARAKYIKEQTAMYTKLWEQQEKGVQAEERAKVVLEDKIAKQRDLWQLKVKEFSQSDNSNYANPKDIANMKQMADNIGNNVTNMRELNQQLHEMNMVYKEISSNSKNTKAMFNDAEKAKEEAEANKQAQQALKTLIATKEEDLRQTHQNITNSKVYREAIDSQKQAFDALKEQLKLTGATTEEVNAQYKQLTQQMNGMKLNMVTEQLGRQGSMFNKIIGTVKRYISLNFDAMDMLNYARRGFQKAFEHVKALDEAYTNINMTMDISNKQFETMRKTAMEVGDANGQLETEVLNMMKVYANAGTTVEEINKQIKASVAFQNVSNLDASTVTQSIQTIVQQYKLLEDGTMDAAEATEYLGDVMVAVSYNLAKEESVAMQEVIAGIETAGNMIKTSGGSFEWFTAVIGTLSEVMNASGSETANAMKMIAARTLKSKEAIDDLTESGEDIEDIEIAASNAEKALNSIGLTARISNGDFKDLEVILGEVAAKWGTLSDATKQYVSEQMAGNNRRSFFIGLMENYTRTMELQQLAESSSGQLMEASEKKAQSLEGRLNILRNSWNKLYEAMLNSSAMKSWIGFGTDSLNVIAKLVEAMNGKWTPAITGAIGYMVTFRKVVSGVSWTEFIGNCIVSAGKLLGLKASADAATVSVTLLKAGLKGLVVGGIIATIAAIAMSFKSLDERTEKATESLENYIAVMDETDSQAQAVEMMDLKIKKINSANTSLENQERLIKEVNAELSKHGEAYGDIKAILDNENLSLEYRLELLDQEIQKRREIAEQTARDAFDDTDWGNDVYDKQRKEAGTKFDILSQSYEDVNFTGGDTTEFEKSWIRVVGEINKSYQEGVKQFNEIRKAYAQELISTEEYEQAYKDFLEFETYYTEQVAKIEQETGRTVEFATQSFVAIHKDATDTMNASQEDYLNKLGQLEDSQQLLADILDEGASRSELMQLLENETFSDFQGDIRNTSEVVEYLTNKVSNLQTEVDSVDTTKFSDLNDSINNVNGEASTMSIKEANEEYIKQLNTINDIKDLLDSITENGYTLEIATDALGSGFLDDFTGSIEDATAVQDHLNQKIAEAQQIANTAYYNMMKDDENFWNTKMKNSEAWRTHEQQVQNDIIKLTAKALNIQETDFANFINTKGGFRQTDYSNANSMAQAENNLQSNLMSQIIGYASQVTNNKASYRQTDMSNVIKFLNTQGAKEAQTVQQLIDLWAKFYDAKKKSIQAEINDYNKRTQELMKSTGAMMEEEAWLEDGALKHGILNATKNLTQLEIDNTAMKNYFAGISAWFNGVGGGVSQNFVGGGGVGGSLGNSRPSTSTGGSGGSGSGSTGGSGSGSDRTVEDMELEIDRYYAYQDAIENVNKALAKNQALQENVTTKAEYKKLVKEEIDLTNQKIKALENLKKEQEKERDELKASLKSNGFTFDGNNNITNYANRLKQLQNWANSITNPDQKEAAIAQVNAIKEMIDKYTELEDSTIPSTTDSINSLKNEIISINKELEENMKLIDALGDRYFDLLRKIAKVDNALALNQAKQDNANDYERIDLLGKEIELLLKRQQLVKEQRDESTKEANELKNQLSSKGVKFDDNGSIVNYKALVKALEDKANGLVGDAQSEAVEEAQDILDLIDKYVTLTEDTLPNLEIEWEKYTNQIQGSKDAIDEIFRSFKQTVTDVQKDIASAYEKYQTERYNKLQESLNKEIELYNKAYEEENFNRDLSKQQRELEEIAQQIAIYSRDTSEAGKARLEQLKKEYEEQQQAINDIIRNKEKDNANDRFDEVKESLDKELEDLLAPEKLVATVNDAIANGMITIGEETIKLDDLMTTWLNDTGDGLYALGDILKSELLENLEKAQGIIGNMNVNGFTMKAPTTTNDKLQAEIDKLKNTSVNGDMNFSLVVQGDVTKDSMPKLEKELKNMENRIYANIAKSLK